MTTRRVQAGMALGLALAGLATVTTAAAAADWPTGPIRIVVPFTPGASTDVVARTIAPALSDALGQPVVIDNRGGAGGIIATETVATAKPDGTTLLVVTTSFAAQPAIMPKLPYDVVTGFAPISLIGDLPGVLVANPKLPVQSFADFLGYAKSHDLTYGSAGIGTFPHLAMELLKSRAKLRLTHVPYKGAAQALVDVLSGQIDVKMDAYVSAHAHIADGSLKALAVSSSTRLAELPGVPTIAESGFPGFEATYWIGLVAPSGVPDAIRARIESAVMTALSPQNRAALTKIGVRPLGEDSATLRALIAREQAQWQQLAKGTDLTKTDLTAQ